MRRVLTRCAVLVVAAGVAGSLVAASATTTPASEDGGEGKLMLVLDSSGSMKEPAAGGKSKIAVAKTALHNVVGDLPDSSQVGMRVYGATVFKKSDRGACTDSQRVVDIGPVDKPALNREIDKYKPYGETPIAYSLKQAVKDLGDEGKRSILLVSDGEETCGSDPCLVARDIAGNGIDLKIDVVGLDVDNPTRNQLKCIADAGHGKYYDADDAVDLEASLGKLSTRAFRDFEVSGEAVEGSKSPDAAPTIKPGQYATTVDAKNAEPEYFTIDKEPGSSLWVSVTARPPNQGQDRQDLAIQMTDPTQTCQAEGSNWSVPLGTHKWQPVFVAATSVDPRVKKTQKCAESDRVLLVIAGRGTTGPGGGWDAELTIDEEPAVDDRSELPPADKAADLSNQSTWRGSAEATKVVGGTGFPDAPTVQTGVYSDTIVPGERLLYRVPAEFGQRVVSDLHFPRTDPATSNALNELPTGQIKGLGVGGQIYGPGRATLNRGDELIVARVVQGIKGVSLALKTPEVRYLNRTVDSLRGASTAGYYYIEVNAAKDDNNQAYTIPFQLKVDVQGEPSGEPEYAELPGGEETQGSADQPSSSAADDSSGGQADKDDDSTLAVAATAGGIGALLVVLIGAAVLLVRRGKNKS